MAGRPRAGAAGPMSVTVISVALMSDPVIAYHRGMSRWEPNARGRLEQAALELFVERGFEQATVAEIAQRAGLTERTFFRYFADKREVLFAGAGALQEFLVRAVAQAPDTATPLEAIAAALQAAAPLFAERGDYPRRRQAVIAANAELRERELIKLAALAAAMAAALRERGTPSRRRPAWRPRPGPRCSASHSSAGPPKTATPTWPSSSGNHSTSSRP